MQWLAKGSMVFCRLWDWIVSLDPVPDYWFGITFMPDYLPDANLPIYLGFKYTIWLQVNTIWYIISRTLVFLWVINCSVRVLTPDCFRCIAVTRVASRQASNREVPTVPSAGVLVVNSPYNLTVVVTHRSRLQVKYGTNKDLCSLWQY